MPLHRLFILGLLAAAIAGLSGCKRKASDNVPANQNTPPATQTAPSLGIKPEDFPSHQALYDAITKYMTANQGRAAKNVDELVAKGFLKPLPALPPGKRYDLDQRSAILKIVD